MFRYLTKSLFVMSLDCPTKVYYHKNRQYANQKQENDFLAALAEGGYQVGELAKFYHPDGYHIETLEYESALRETEHFLNTGNATIYEAAIRWQNCFIRVDILKKAGNNLELIEVKSKSLNRETDDFLSSKGEIYSGWKPYLYDVAFQKFVLSHAFPDSEISAFLMLADKTKKASVNSLNQWFPVVKENGRLKVKSENIKPSMLGDEILIKVNVDDIIEILMKEKILDQSFEAYINFMSEQFRIGQKVSLPVDSRCKGCEFQTTPEDERAGYRSGFRECWTEKLKWSEEDFAKPSVFDLWNFRRTDDLLSAGIYFMEDIPDDYLLEENSATGESN